MYDLMGVQLVHSLADLSHNAGHLGLGHGLVLLDLLEELTARAHF